MTHRHHQRPRLLLPSSDVLLCTCACSNLHAAGRPLFCVCAVGLGITAAGML